MGAEDGSASSSYTGGSQIALGRPFLGPYLLRKSYFFWSDSRSGHAGTEVLLRYANVRIPYILQVFCKIRLVSLSVINMEKRAGDARYKLALQHA